MCVGGGVGPSAVHGHGPWVALPLHFLCNMGPRRQMGGMPVHHVYARSHRSLCLCAATCENELAKKMWHACGPHFEFIRAQLEGCAHVRVRLFVY